MSSIAVFLRMLAETFKSVSNIVFPRICPVCGRRLSAGERAICTACSLSLPYTRFGARRNNPVERLFLGRFPLTRASAYIFYQRATDTRNMIFSLKYLRHPQIGVELGKRMAAELMSRGFFEGIDVIVPVPLARRRERRRGYNQSLMIARGIGSVAGISVDNGLLLRIVDNPTQTMRTAKQRLENVEGIFRAVNEERIRGRHVLLVDDVVTTGATITACADRLVAAGARTISVLTLAASSSVGVF